MPVKVDRALIQSEGLLGGLNNNRDILTGKGNGQKRIDDLTLAHANVVDLNTKQITAQTFMENMTTNKNAMLLAAKEAVAQVDDAASSAFEGDKAKLKEFRIGDPKPRTEEGWETYLDSMVGPVQLNSDALVANGMSQDDIANFPVVYANLVAALAVQRNATKVRNSATKTRDAAAAALEKKVTVTRKFAQAALKGNKAALEEIKPVKMGGRKSGRVNPPPVPEAATASKK